MARIQIKDLPEDQEISEDEMRKIVGGGDTSWGRVSDSSYGRVSDSSYGRVSDSSYGRVSDSSWGRVSDSSYGRISLTQQPVPPGGTMGGSNLPSG